jgi:hypothetical protein
MEPVILVTHNPLHVTIYYTFSSYVLTVVIMKSYCFQGYDPMYKPTDEHLLFGSYMFGLLSVSSDGVSWYNFL